MAESHEPAYISGDMVCKQELISGQTKLKMNKYRQRVKPVAILG
jgi:hypothetical protein